MIDIRIPQTCPTSPFKDDRHSWKIVLGTGYVMYRAMLFRLVSCEHCKLLVLIHGLADGSVEAAPKKEDQVLFMTDGRDFLR